jgi:hypothetical protein
MPTDINELGIAAQEQVLKAVEAIQATVLDSAKAWADIVEKAIPVDLPKFDIPGADKLPTPEQALSFGFDFAQKLLNSQREFASKLVATVSPAIKA